jgi:hypothetical protein
MNQNCLLFIEEQVIFLALLTYAATERLIGMYSMLGFRGHGRIFVKNRVSRVSLFIALALGVVNASIADEIQFQPAQLLYAGASQLDVGDYAIPCVTDWNGDGKKDLLVGYQTAGKIALYINAGTDANPVFSTSANLNGGPSNITFTSSGCGAPAPFVCDYNNDGKRDLLVGQGANGYVYFYCNTNTDTAPVLASGQQIKVGAKALSVVERAAPYTYDWNSDGLMDLLCGTGGGTNVVFINVGTAMAPVYSSGTAIKANGAVLNLGIRSVVRMFDWDGDGKKDLVGSSNTGIYWCKNTGTPTSPVLQAMVALKAPVAGGLAPINTGLRMRLDLVDWNNDGVMDLLVGGTAGTISYYNGYRFSIRLLGRDMCDGHIVEWNSAPYLSYNVLAGQSISGVTNRVASGVPSSGVTTCWTNDCGDPQQFFRVQIAQ